LHVPTYVCHRDIRHPRSGICSVEEVLIQIAQCPPNEFRLPPSFSTEVLLFFLLLLELLLLLLQQRQNLCRHTATPEPLLSHAHNDSEVARSSSPHTGSKPEGAAGLGCPGWFRGMLAIMMVDLSRAWLGPVATALVCDLALLWVGNLKCICNHAISLDQVLALGLDLGVD
jgi:hypothetical protein